MAWRSQIPRITNRMLPALDAGLEAGAHLVAERAKARAPVGAPTIHLRDAIHVEREGLLELAIVAGDDKVFYGHIVEHGSVHAAPHPFLVPALEESAAEVVALTRQALRELT